MKRIIAGAALGWVVAFAPMPGAASNNDAKAAQEKNAGERASDAKSAKQPDQLDTCKREADGKKGPERSRFMTACLKERKE